MWKRGLFFWGCGCGVAYVDRRYILACLDFYLPHGLFLHNTYYRKFILMVYYREMGCLEAIKTDLLLYN